MFYLRFFPCYIMLRNMDSAIKTELDKLKELIVGAIQVDQIYLFGSCAYGKPHRDSDLDLFVVLKDEVQMRDIDAAILIRTAISDHQLMPIDLLVMKKACIWNEKPPPRSNEK